MKILYAASDHENSCIQLSRFLQAMQGSEHTIEIAAFKSSSPKNVNIRWTLNCLHDIAKPNQSPETGQNFEIYFQQVRYYKPDLVISDLEYFTSHIANILNIPLWQCNSMLIYLGLVSKNDITLHKNYAFLRGDRLLTGRENNVLDNSDCNLVYSHLGDTAHPPVLKSNFQWVRPYHTIGKKSIPCQHSLVAGLLHNNKKVVSLLKRYQDCVAFTEFPHEKHADLWLKNISNQEEYFCNLRNCHLFICQGQTSFLADAFYNGKYSVVLPNFQDVECVTNSIFTERNKLGTIFYRADQDLEPYLEQTVVPQIDHKIPYLHEKINNLQTA